MLKNIVTYQNLVEEGIFINVTDQIIHEELTNVPKVPYLPATNEDHAPYGQQKT